MEEKSGKIINIKANNLYIKYKNKVFLAKSLGKLKYENIMPIVGDNVIFEVQNEEGRESFFYVTKIKKRKNELDKPKIANVDNALIFTSIFEPILNTKLLDKLLFLIWYARINPIIVFTKSDFLTSRSNSEIEQILNWYQKLSFSNFIINKFDFETIEPIKKIMQNKYNVIIGQTGVGKSTFINLLDHNLKLKTQIISKALNRGKHTTSASAIYKIEKNINIIDTPGFSSINIDVKNNTYPLYFSHLIFKKHLCKFPNCTHLIEKETCAILKAYYNKEIPSFVYQNYQRIFKEINEGARSSK